MDEPTFETPAHLATFVEQLAARDVGGKFMYAGAGARRHERFATDHPDDYEHGRAEEEFAAIVAATGGALPAQVCDIGTSNGVHTRQLLASYLPSRPGTRLLALDFSPQILRFAARRLAGLGLPCTLADWDVEAGPSRDVATWRGPGPVLGLLLGNTLGNVRDPQAVLENVGASLEAGDLLAVGLYLRTTGDASEAVDYYRREEVLGLIAHPLYAAGFEPAGVRLHVRWESDAVLAEAEMLTGARVLGVELGQGERIRCFLSRRHRVGPVRSLLRRSGWEPVHTAVHGHRGVFVARRR